MQRGGGELHSEKKKKAIGGEKDTRAKSQRSMERMG